MIAKKNKKANLERKRFAFFQIGLLVAGSLVLAAFEYSTVAVDGKQVTYVEPETPGEILPEIPEDFDKPKEEKKVFKPKVINLASVDSFTINNNMNMAGVATTSNTNITMDEGWGDPTDGIDLGISGLEVEPILPAAEKEPSFVGGEAAMRMWLGNEIRYPQMCADMGIEGITYIQFVVNTDGSICQVKELKSPHEDLTAEAKRVVKKMPKWNPGEQAGKKVRVRFTIPIKFVLH